MTKSTQFDSEDLPVEISCTDNKTRGLSSQRRLQTEGGNKLRILSLLPSSGDVERIENAMREGGLSFSNSHAADEATCRALLHERLPDLLLVDVNMPGFSGGDALSMVRECGSRIPVIFISRAASVARWTELFELGASDCISWEELTRLAPSILRALRESRIETERLRAEEKFRGIFESLTVGIYYASAVGEIVTMNSAMARILGCDSPEEAMAVAGLCSLDQIYVEPTRKAELLHQISDKETVQNFEAQLYRKDKKPVWVSQNVRVVADSISGKNLIEVIVEEITRRKELEAHMLRIQRMECIGTLASGLVHELKNILSPILMSAPLLRYDFPPDKREMIISTIEASAKRGTDLVKQVLSFSRGEEERGPLILAEVAEEIAGIISATFPKSIVFEQQGLQDLPPVLWEATHLHQVLLNLCLNARDAMPEGGRLRLSARTIERGGNPRKGLTGVVPGRYVAMEVSDTGCGIPHERIAKIFDPFFTTKPLGQGTGLGLSTALEIANSNGGFLEVRSEPGRGSTFTLTMPVAAGQCPEKPHLDQEDYPRGKGELVLVVDDDAAIGACVKRVLEQNGYSVLLAYDGAEALALYVQHKETIAAVLTDNLMPVIDGITLIRSLRKLNPNVMVILSTGLSEKTREQELKQLHVENILQKPYNPSTLLRTLYGLFHSSAGIAA